MDVLNIQNSLLKIIDWSIFSKIQLIMASSVHMDLGLLYMSFKVMAQPLANIEFLKAANGVLYVYLLIGSMLFLLGFWLKKYNKFGNFYAHLGVNYNAISMLLSAFALGIINITNGVIFIGSCLILMILLPKKVVYWGIANTAVLFLVLICLTVNGSIHYAPIFQPYVTFSADIQNFYLINSSIYMVFYSALMIWVLNICLRNWNLKNEQIKQLSLMDGLTELYNRRVLEKAQHNFTASGVPENCGLIILDLDNFKQINDEHGHFFGDQVLKHVAKILKEKSRADDLPIRYGGEEFLLLLKNTSKHECHQIAGRILSALNQEPVQLNLHQNLIVTASMGVSHSHDNFKNFDELFKAADEQLYLAKSLGKNQICMI
ncbi:GGDEF domain-containing protein [Acinetobacter pragensis]|uniref:diguanylate cyclase n=1 Tax=Acinetobacter pragensis TaxID=1806892 RepID=A0A151Y1S7_9GAMM|nr:GGDEF domain-containing protein [Acinetobacter pragensis]KYQ71996.1 hypothetical protein AZH43_12295 [Acinetobacter pragensis]